jgi:hypothetical protein
MRDIQRIGDLDAIEHDFDLKRINVDSSAEAFAPFNNSMFGRSPGAESYVSETGKSMKGTGLAVSREDCCETSRL